MSNRTSNRSSRSDSVSSGGSTSTRSTIKLPQTITNGNGRVRPNYKETSASEESASDSDDNQREESRDKDSSESDCMERVVVKKKKLKRDISISIETSFNVRNNYSDTSGKETAPVSPVSSTVSASSNTTRLSDNDGDEEETPQGEWEIEKILDYIKDDFGEMYWVKWKDWSDDFNTWEPLAHLVNCDDELYRFYKERKRSHLAVLEESEYVVLPNGKRRRKGPSLPMVPPDPRSYDIRVQEFFDATGCTLGQKDILTVFLQWKAKKISSKSRWPTSKVNKYLEDAVDGKLSNGELISLKEQIILMEVEEKNKALSEEIRGWEKKINGITQGKPYITVENDVDMSGPPIEFLFVNDYVAGDGVIIPTDPPVGCGCVKKGVTCYDERENCCAMQSGYKFAYTKYGKVNVLRGSPIYECNSKCKCGPDCPNRVVQDGKSDHKLSIFRTNDGRGWGVKTLKSIKKGSFVTLYVGEVITSEEADRRGKVYDKNGCTYLFDLDFNDLESNPYAVDASAYGNVAHFINHSCSPNLGVYAVWVDCLDPNLPKLAMFALRDIARNEELTFDYNYNAQRSGSQPDSGDEEAGDDNSPRKGKTVCLCGTPKCRKYIF